ncbi:hypothetical protein F8568_016875 [Actinomadura sp. LD22]|uniref:Uncharacterized protein n=1 Tax=Actinomadura physcomitrii TaxID=2650748 RepID=A0A6I4MC51_9ACTN|nr:hypothetical protein [Actinomadura physcomitrii]MWA02015.1 hypothetical protein [Actinomadura physcomitrii]
MSADQDDASPESEPARPAPDDVLVAGGPPRTAPALPPPPALPALPAPQAPGATAPDGLPHHGPGAGMPPQAPGAPGMPEMAAPPAIPGMPLPPGIGGPPPRAGRLRKRLVTGAGVAVVVAAAATVAAVFISDGDGGGKARPKPSATAPSAWALEAGRQLTSGPGFRYQGTLTAANGRPVRADLQVTAAGSAIGTFTAGPLTAEVVAAGGGTYIKAGTQFWREYAGESAHPDNYAGRWSKAPASVPGFDVPDVLGAQAIAKLLTKAPAKPPAETVNGVRAYKIKTSGANYLVSAAAPYRLLAVQAAGADAARFSVADLPNPAALFARLRPRVKALAGAADPNLHFDPGKLTFVDCDQNTAGCTVRVPATLSSPDTVPDGARAALRASITTRGTALGSCTSSAPVPSDRSFTLSCTVTGRAWRTWVKSALDHPGSYPYSAQARVIGEALTAADVKALLADLDKERSAVVKSTLSGAPGGATGTPAPGATGAPGGTGAPTGPRAAVTGGTARP